jgi:hypothetical protein
MLGTPPALGMLRSAMGAAERKGKRLANRKKKKKEREPRSEARD